MPAQPASDYIKKMLFKYTLYKMSTKDTARTNSLMFIRDFITEGKDENIPLSETYYLYCKYVKEKFPNDPVLSTQTYNRITSAYFFKKHGAKNDKAISLSQLEKDLLQKLKNIQTSLKTIGMVKRNRQELLAGIPSGKSSDSEVSWEELIASYL
jgi:hypothetical protein